MPGRVTSGHRLYEHDPMHRTQTANVLVVGTGAAGLGAAMLPLMSDGACCNAAVAILVPAVFLGLELLFGAVHCR
jgi:hypothetical protein